MSQPNPIRQGITLANNLGAFQALVAAVQTVDPEQKDETLDSVRKTLDASLARNKAELNALINLYGG